MKKTNLIALIIILVVAALSIEIYLILHNTLLTSIVVADDMIVISDGRGPYKPEVDGVFLGKVSAGAGDLFISEFFIMDMNHSSRSVYVNFTQALWKDANLKDVPSRLPSKNYEMALWILAVDEPFKPLDLFMMNVGEKYSAPELQILIIFGEPDTGALVNLNAIREMGGLSYFYDIFFNSTASELPQSLRDDIHIQLTRASEEAWVLDVDGWFASYHLSSLGDFLENYIRLSLNLTIYRNRAI